MATIDMGLVSVWLGSVDPNIATHWVTKPTEVNGELFVECNQQDPRFIKMLSKRLEMVDAIASARNAAVDGIMKEAQAKGQEVHLAEQGPL
eukprot:1309075-Pyramimonas_sp.AAC.1